MTNQEFFARAREIGPAIWLLTLYWAACKPDVGPWFVVDVDSLADEEVAAFLSISTPTAIRWHQRLMRTGFVQAERSGRGYRIRVQRPPLVTVAIRTLREHSRVCAEWPAMQTEVLQ